MFLEFLIQSFKDQVFVAQRRKKYAFRLLEEL